jgi:phage virion morphogenesis protein
MIGLQVDAAELVRMIGHMQLLALTAKNPRQLVQTIAKGVETQTKHRIANEKTAPDGEHWAPWSPGYAATRTSANSLLVGEHPLLDSITGQAVSNTDALIFSTVPYAGVHQFGLGGIPARPYLGLSDQNAADIENWLGRAVADILLTGEPPAGVR